MLVDIEQVKSHVDCRELIARDLGKRQGGNTKYDQYRCPLHREQKGASLTVTAEGWKCWGKCQKSGDAIGWLMERHAMTFQEAAQALIKEFHIDMAHQASQRRQERRPPPSQPPPDPIEPPSESWQAYAKAVATKAQTFLWAAPEAAPKLDYLRKRGLSDVTIQQAGLGYVPPRSESDLKYGRVLIPGWTKADGKPVRIPCGIMIPHYADGHLWALRFRTDSGEPKYIGVSGGRNSLYWADNVKPGLPLMIVEGEFDCLILAQAIPDLVSPVAIVGASNNRINPRWYRHFLFAPIVLARMDQDDAGQKALQNLRELSACVRPIRVPRGKDVNEYFLGCGDSHRMRMTAWIENALDEE